jgi:hypothetical protein
MRSWRDSLLLAFLLCTALGTPLDLGAIEAGQGSSQSIRDAAAKARDLLQTINMQIRDLEYAIQNTSGSASRITDSYEYRDLKRSARDLSEVSNAVFDLASRCGADGKKIAQSFRSSVRKLSSDINRMDSQAAATFARMTINDLNSDVEAIARDLQGVMSVPVCSPGAEDESKE